MLAHNVRQAVHDRLRTGLFRRISGVGGIGDKYPLVTKMTFVSTGRSYVEWLK